MKVRRDAKSLTSLHILKRLGAKAELAPHRISRSLTHSQRHPTTKQQPVQASPVWLTGSYKTFTMPESGHRLYVKGKAACSIAPSLSKVPTQYSRQRCECYFSLRSSCVRRCMVASGRGNVFLPDCHHRPNETMI
jgi:hypothetical protein